MFSVAWDSPARAAVWEEDVDEVFVPPRPELRGYSYTAAAGEINALNLTSLGRTLVVTDPNASITVATPQAPCTQESPGEVVCPLPDEPALGVLALVVELGDQDDGATADLRTDDAFLDLSGGPGDDRLASTGTLSSTVRGGVGNDSLTGGDGFQSLLGDAGIDQLDGGPGGDSLYGGSGTDHLDGGAGTDSLDGGPEADVLSGGAGRDAVVYSGRKLTSVSLDGRANDGARGERDWVRRDVENAEINRGRVVGNRQANSLRVGEGTAIGGAGDDGLAGSGKLHGGPGNDEISGSGRSTVAYGEAGNDRLVAFGGGSYDGGSGDDRLGKSEEARGTHLVGGAGDDKINSRDTGNCDRGPDQDVCFPVAVRDRVSCGPGHDSVTAGELDIVDPDCERIKRERIRRP